MLFVNTKRDKNTHCNITILLQWAFEGNEKNQNTKRRINEKPIAFDGFLHFQEIGKTLWNGQTEPHKSLLFAVATRSCTKVLQG